MGKFIQDIKISLLTIDEVHCISEWGHSFRPNYLRLSKFYNSLNTKRLLMLTATAPNYIVNDICNKFNVLKNNVVRTPFHRSNLEIRVSLVNKNNRDEQLKIIIKNNTGASIVYVTKQKTAEYVSKLLKENNINAYC